MLKHNDTVDTNSNRVTLLGRPGKKKKKKKNEFDKALKSQQNGPLAPYLGLDQKSRWGQSSPRGLQIGRNLGLSDTNTMAKTVFDYRINFFLYSRLKLPKTLFFGIFSIWAQLGVGTKFCLIHPPGSKLLDL